LILYNLYKLYSLYRIEDSVVFGWMDGVESSRVVLG